ncbi:DUF4244 domain-containing protein [Geodermatophilus sp. DSM 45219]|uniref:DUF4244 domain-containing protein n=1 Tax=Geodermatophilus sp. DSM 45219 TaxID=1881103 RepID=UPI0008876C40|nr:DUF4244 domain-containing protein [Geodermatophilus sp. DSM 45219]SDN50648.1 Protein of unknown function [Geodermatophilus sp. DSM 45219]
MTVPCETRFDGEEQPDASGAAAEGETTPTGGLRARWARVRATAEAGMSTAEYAVGTVAACAFAAVLYRVVTGGSVVDGLSALVADALATLS